MASRKYTVDQLLALKGSKRELSMEKALFETTKDSQVLCAYLPLSFVAVMQTDRSLQPTS